jgi:hypothetical protein
MLYNQCRQVRNMISWVSHIGTHGQRKKTRACFFPILLALVIRDSLCGMHSGKDFCRPMVVSLHLVRIPELVRND